MGQYSSKHEISPLNLPSDFVEEKSKPETINCLGYFKRCVYVVREQLRRILFLHNTGVLQQWCVFSENGSIDRWQHDSPAPEGPLVGRVLQGVRHHAAGKLM